MTFRLAARLTLLVGTTWVLIATSPPRGTLPSQCFDQPIEAQTFRVEGTCGPSGTVEILSMDCELSVDGGLSVGLPEEGHQVDAGRLLSTDLTLTGVVYDLERVPRQPDGGLDFTCDGGCPTVFRSCAGTFSDGGFSVNCASVAAPDCTSRLVPVSR